MVEASFGLFTDPLLFVFLGFLPLAALRSRFFFKWPASRVLRPPGAGPVAAGPVAVRAGETHRPLSAALLSPQVRQDDCGRLDSREPAPLDHLHALARAARDLVA